MSNRLGKKKLIYDNHNDGKQPCEVVDEMGVEKDTEIIIMEQRKIHFHGMFSNQCCLRVYTIVGLVKKNENI